MKSIKMLNIYKYRASKVQESYLYFYGVVLIHALARINSL